MKVQELRQWLSKFDDDLTVVFCSGDSEQFRILKLSDIGVSDAFIQRRDDGILYSKFGKTAISERYVFVNIKSAE
jgi:hypothetical protein